MRTKMTFITGPGIHVDMNHPLPYTSNRPSVTHQLIAACEKDYDVAVITTCEDTLHEQAGSAHVIRINGQSDAAIIWYCQKILNESDVVICLNCCKTMEPIRSILIGVRPDSRFYNSCFSDGENKYPRLHNVTQAFRLSVFALPDEAVQDILNDLSLFPITGK